ncbi:hypothetical protein ABZ177_05470 [Streptomyces sp. NPDC006284]|uniref:hypothetical protein n=1 Tax=Streptomyces sp. NPDC006284 TaxID=3156742 RepID=UPI0033BB4D8B
MDEIDLIRTIDASRYAEPQALCTPSCRQALVWSDWEMDLAKAMYEVLRSLENALRCTISDRLSSHYGRDDWWKAKRLQLTHSTTKMIADAEKELLKESLPLTPAAIQRQVTLGFWVTLLGSGADYETQLWRPVSAGFPNYRGRRFPLWSRLNELRKLRNKVAHQERIGGRNLAADRHSALTAIGYVSEPLANRVEVADTAIPVLLANRPGACPRRMGSES